MNKKGIDISYWQGNVNFKSVKNDGIDFVIFRQGYGTSIDNKFLTYVKGAKTAKLDIHGVYHFSYATTEKEAQAQAKACIKNIEKAGLDKNIIIFYDFEYDSVAQAKKKGINLGKKQCILLTNAFCQYVESQGYKAGVYANLDYTKNMYDSATLKKYIFWLAQYNDGETPTYKCLYHQYSSKGTVRGISGNVDMNYYYEPVKVLKSITTIAEEVIDGKWGTGEERKQNLAVAGYDPAKVQTKVNEILSKQNTISLDDLIAKSRKYFTLTGKTAPSRVKYLRGKVTVGALYVRTWAGTENPPLAVRPTIIKGTKVQVCDSILASNGTTWYYIKIDNKIYGFVSSQYIEKV